MKARSGRSSRGWACWPPAWICPWSRCALKGSIGYCTAPGAWPDPAACGSLSETRCICTETITLLWRGRWRMRCAACEPANNSVGAVVDQRAFLFAIQALDGALNLQRSTIAGQPPAVHDRVTRTAAIDDGIDDQHVAFPLDHGTAGTFADFVARFLTICCKTKRRCRSGRLTRTGAAANHITVMFDLERSRGGLGQAILATAGRIQSPSACKIRIRSHKQRNSNQNQQNAASHVPPGNPATIIYAFPVFRSTHLPIALCGPAGSVPNPVFGRPAFAIHRLCKPAAGPALAHGAGVGQYGQPRGADTCAWRPGSSIFRLRS